MFKVSIVISLTKSHTSASFMSCASSLPPTLDDSFMRFTLFMSRALSTWWFIPTITFQRRLSLMVWAIRKGSAYRVKSTEIVTWWREGKTNMSTPISAPTRMMTDSPSTRAIVVHRFNITPLTKISRRMVPLHSPLLQWSRPRRLESVSNSWNLHFHITLS